MAIVFISPQKRKKLLIHFITVGFAMVLVAVALIFFLRVPKPIESEKVFKPPEIEINLDVLKSEHLTALRLFEMRVKKEFIWQARDENNQPQEGKILTVSVEEAKKRLGEFGLKDIEVQESKIGRENPFIPPIVETPLPEGETEEGETQEGV